MSDSNLLCPFCLENNLLRVNVLYQDDMWYITDMEEGSINNAVMGITKRHIETPFKISKDEWISLHALLRKMKKLVDEKETPDGYNLGWNVHKTGGQNVAHAHLHLLADPINLVFFGNERDIHKSFEAAKWTIADPLGVFTFLHAAFATVFNRSYPHAPVGSMYLFGRQQDFAYQLQVGNSPKVRHHIRFWKVPKGWRLPGGHEAEWLAAATYDKSVGIKLFTLQIDHMIATNIDEERDFIINDLNRVNAIESMEVIEHFTDAYHDHNNGGDTIQTDGSLPFINLHKL